MSPDKVQLLDLLDALGEGVIFVEEDRVRYINRAARTFLGVPGAHGLPLIAALRDHRLERVYTEGVAAECETRGRVLWVSPFTNGLLLQDITERKRAEETARELLAVLSHELRTPVATIRATLSALQGEVPDKLRTRFLERAEAESGRLVRLLNDLTVDVKPPRYRSVFLPDVVARALGLVAQTLAAHEITLVQEVEALTVWTDEDKLLQVLINLLENAAIHGPDAGTVTLKTSVEPGWLRLYVVDEGQPLAPDTLTQLFEPHTQGASVKSKGTGLGLYIVRSIAERWGGEAWGRPLANGNEFGVSVRLAPGP